jgi:hypothetical protein
MTIMTAAQLVTLLLFALLPLGSAMAAEVEEAPEVIVVTGRLPGPPLWKVSSGENVLWIFPYLTWIPQGMVWESERVARVIAQSQEALGLPETGLQFSPLQVMNPFFVARGFRNTERNTRSPGGGTLEENLPPELYARFAALQARYVPQNPDPDLQEVQEARITERPMVAGGQMMDAIRSREGLVPGDDILKTIQRLVRRNRGIRRTEISTRLYLGNGFDEYEQSLNALWASIRPEDEQACFERQVRHMEEDLDGMKRLANSWAEGYIDGYRDVDEFHNATLWPFNQLHACAELLMDGPGVAQEALAGMITRVNEMWLDAAEKALATNASTFAILPINELVAADGLLSTLAAKGYEVREP